MKITRKILQIMDFRDLLIRSEQEQLLEFTLEKLRELLDHFLEKDLIFVSIHQLLNLNF